MLSWIYLLLAGCMEIVGVFVMKQFVLTKRKIFLLAKGGFLRGLMCA